MLLLWKDTELGDMKFKSIKDIDTFFKKEDSNISFEPDLLGALQINKGQAEIHMMALAEAMWDAMNESTPKILQENE